MRILSHGLTLARQVAHSVLRKRVFVRSVGPAAGCRLRPGPSGTMLLDAVGLGRLVKPTAEQLFLVGLQGLEGGVVYDIGGLIGELTLGFARKVGHAGRIITFEPNPVNQEFIRQNLALNVTCPVDLIPVGVGSGPARLEMVFLPGSTATGSLDASIQTSMRSVPSRRCTVDVDSLDRLVNARDLPLPKLVKIDVEGLELEVLRGMEQTVARAAPALYIELHGVDLAAKRHNAALVVEWLLGHGYAVHHVEKGIQVSKDNLSNVYSGHLYAAIDGR